MKTNMKLITRSMLIITALALVAPAMQGQTTTNATTVSFAESFKDHPDFGLGPCVTDHLGQSKLTGLFLQGQGLTADELQADTPLIISINSSTFFDCRLGCDPHYVPGVSTSGKITGHDDPGFTIKKVSWKLLPDGLLIKGSCPLGRLLEHQPFVAGAFAGTTELINTTLPAGLICVQLGTNTDCAGELGLRGTASSKPVPNSVADCVLNAVKIKTVTPP
jgi:hypothetical protein